MRKRSARGTMSRETVVDAALAIADRAGFDAVTMRAIAAEVGATPMALYAYFSDKNALYGGMRERIFSAHVGVGSAKISRDTWQSMLEGMARGLYQVIHEHPNWTPVFAYHRGPATSGLGFLDESVRLMLKDGFAQEDTFPAYWSAMSFAVGSAMCERIMMGADGGSPIMAHRCRARPSTPRTSCSCSTPTNRLRSPGCTSPPSRSLPICSHGSVTRNAGWINPPGRWGSSASSRTWTRRFLTSLAERGSRS